MEQAGQAPQVGVLAQVLGQGAHDGLGLEAVGAKVGFGVLGREQFQGGGTVDHDG